MEGNIKLHNRGINNVTLRDWSGPIVVSVLDVAWREWLSPIWIRVLDVTPSWSEVLLLPHLLLLLAVADRLPQPFCCFALTHVDDCFLGQPHHWCCTRVVISA